MSIPIPRKFDGDLTTVPRRWVAGSALATAISNGLSMLFPHGERFFVRSVNFYLDQITDPHLRAQVKAFFKQEGHHASAHDDFNAVLRKQGFEIDQFLEGFARTLAWVEAHVPAKLNLAGTAAAEHFTAIMAEGAFVSGMIDTLEPSVQLLAAWHSAEEIEHKAVAFDVLKEIDPSYVVRVAGLAIATVILATFWARATAMLLRQEKLSLRQLYREYRTNREKRTKRGEAPVITGVFLAGIRQYLRRDFHPNQNATDHLAADWFRSRGLPFVSPAEQESGPSGPARGVA